MYTTQMLVLDILQDLELKKLLTPEEAASAPTSVDTDEDVGRARDIIRATLNRVVGVVDNLTT